MIRTATLSLLLALWALPAWGQSEPIVVAQDYGSGAPHVGGVFGAPPAAVGGGGPATDYYFVVFEAADFGTASTEYLHISGSGTGIETTEADAANIISGALTFKTLYVEFGGNLFAPENSIVTLMKNGTATDLTCEVTAGNGSCTDSTDVSVDSGDTVSLRHEDTGTVNNNISIWLLAEPDSDNKRIYTTSGDSLSTGATDYLAINNITASTTEASRSNPVSAECTVTAIAAKLSADPGTGSQSYKFEVREDGSDTNIECTIDGDDSPDFECTGTGSALIEEANLISISVVPSSTPTSVNASVSIECDHTDDDFMIFAGVTNTSSANRYSGTGWNPVPVNCGNTESIAPVTLTANGICGVAAGSTVSGSYDVQFMDDCSVDAALDATGISGTAPVCDLTGTVSVSAGDSINTLREDNSVGTNQIVPSSISFQGP